MGLDSGPSLALNSLPSPASKIASPNSPLSQPTVPKSSPPASPRLEPPLPPSSSSPKPQVKSPPPRVSSPKPRLSSTSSKETPEKSKEPPARHSKLSIRLPFGRKKKQQQQEPLPATPAQLLTPQEEPFTTVSAAGEDVEAVKQLVGMGFSRAQAVIALENHGYDVQRALNSLLPSAA